VDVLDELDNMAFVLGVVAKYGVYVVARQAARSYDSSTLAK
jgi:hypothetical protein